LSHPEAALHLQQLFIFILPLLIVQAGWLGAEDPFRDASGNEIYLPKTKSVISFAAPGIWQSVAGMHEPSVKTKVRKEGLENVRVIKIRFSSPIAKDDPDAVKAVYLLDKDAIIVGYHAFSAGEQEAEFSINGVINYIHLLVECPRHGLWTKELRL
jgi:hypothetical protein